MLVIEFNVARIATIISVRVEKVGIAITAFAALVGTAIENVIDIVVIVMRRMWNTATGGILAPVPLLEVISSNSPNSRVDIITVIISVLVVVIVVINNGIIVIAVGIIPIIVIGLI